MNDYPIIDWLLDELLTLKRRGRDLPSSILLTPDLYQDLINEMSYASIWPHDVGYQEVRFNSPWGPIRVGTCRDIQESAFLMNKNRWLYVSDPSNFYEPISEASQKI